MTPPSPSDEELLAARHILDEAERSVLDDVRAVRSEASQLLEAARCDAARLREEAAAAPASADPVVTAAEADGLVAGAEASVADLQRLQAHLQTQVELLAQVPEGALAQAVADREAALEDLRAALDARAAALEHQEVALAEREAALGRSRIDLDGELAARRAACEAEAAAVGARAAIDAAAALTIAHQTAAGLIAEADAAAGQRLAQADDARQRGFDDALAALDEVRSRLVTTRDPAGEAGPPSPTSLSE
ncbi:MAG: hypothetical protein ABIP36_00715 [Acidimicrobiales bacterium]